MREALCNIFQLVQTPPDSSNARLWEREEVPDLQQDVREHASPQHARAYPQPQPQVRRLRQGLLQAVAATGTFGIGRNFDFPKIFFWQ